MSGVCTPPGAVVFDYDTWAASFPELAAYVSLPQAQGYFNQAQLYVNNTACSPVSDNQPGGTRETILNLLTAHIAQLFAPLGNQQSSPLVGRISNASEGSVSVGTDMAGAPGSAAWFNQTKYGAAAWQAMAPYRTMRYFPGRRPYLGVTGPGGGWGGGYGGSFGAGPYGGTG